MPVEIVLDAEGKPVKKDGGYVLTDGQRQFVSDLGALAPKDPRLAELERMQSTLRTLLVGKEIATSKFLSDKTMLTPDMAEALWGRHFDVVETADGPRAVAKDSLGQIIKGKAGDATVDEALEALFNAWSSRDRFRRATGGSKEVTEDGRTLPNETANPHKMSNEERLKFVAKHGFEAFQRLMQSTPPPKE